MSWVTLPLVYAITFFGTPFGGGGPSVEHERSLPLMRVGIPTVSMLSTRHALERLPKWVRVKWPGPKASGSGGQKRTWVGHWRVERSEDDKAEAVLKAEGVPYVARQIAMRFKPERRFYESDNGQLIGELKTVTGGWSQMDPEHDTTFRSGGYRSKAHSTWQGDTVLCTITTVVGPLGGKSTTTTRHYMEGQLLVSETRSSGGMYKTYFRKDKEA